MGTPRLRVQVADELVSQLQDPFLKHSWLLVPEDVATIEQLAEVVTQRLQLGIASSAELLLSIQGFTLPADGPISLLRNGDLVLVSLKAYKQAIRSARKQPPSGGAAHSSGAAAAVLPAANGVQLAGHKRALPASGASPANQQQPCKCAHVAAGTQMDRQPDSSSSEEAETADDVKAAGERVNGAPAAANGGHTEVKKRSRSATRKALKRKLRREGVLPNPNRKRQQPQQPQGRHQQQQQPQQDAEQALPTGALQQRSCGVSKQAVASASKQPSVLEVAALAPALNPNLAWQAMPQRQCHTGHLHYKAQEQATQPHYPPPHTLSPQRRQQGQQCSSANAATVNGNTANGGAVKQSANAAGVAAKADADGAGSSSSSDVSSDDSSSSSSSDNSSESSSSESSDDSTSSEESSSSDEEEEEQEQQGAQPAAVRKYPAAGALQNGHAAKHVSPAMPDFASLALLQGMPMLGDVLAYKLLEVGPNWTPVVSEVRHGQVTCFDSTTAQLTLQPWPDASVHPLRKPADAAAQLAAADEEEEPALASESPYDEAGVLTADMGSFVELRVVCAAAGRSVAIEGPAGAALAGGVAAAANGHMPAQHPPADTDAVKDVTDKLTGITPRVQTPNLGPPKPATATLSATKAARPGIVIPAVGAWKSVADQLQSRRQELQASQAELAEATGEAPSESEQQQQQQQQQPASAGKVAPTQQQQPARPAGVKTPGAARPRGGVRSGAVGPLLAALRAQQS